MLRLTAFAVLLIISAFANQAGNDALNCKDGRRLAVHDFPEFQYTCEEDLDQQNDHQHTTWQQYQLSSFNPSVTTKMHDFKTHPLFAFRKEPKDCQRQQHHFATPPFRCQHEVLHTLPGNVHFYENQEKMSPGNEGDESLAPTLFSSTLVKQTPPFAVRTITPTTLPGIPEPSLKPLSTASSWHARLLRILGDSRAIGNRFQEKEADSSDQDSDNGGLFELHEHCHGKSTVGLIPPLEPSRPFREHHGIRYDIQKGHLQQQQQKQLQQQQTGYSAPLGWLKDLQPTRPEQNPLATSTSTLCQNCDNLHHVHDCKNHRVDRYHSDDNIDIKTVANPESADPLLVPFPASVGGYMNQHARHQRAPKNVEYKQPGRPQHDQHNGGYRKDRERLDHFQHLALISTVRIPHMHRHHTMPPPPPTPRRIYPNRKQEALLDRDDKDRDEESQQRQEKKEKKEKNVEESQRLRPEESQRLRPEESKNQVPSAVNPLATKTLLAAMIAQMTEIPFFDQVEERATMESDREDSNIQDGSKIKKSTTVVLEIEEITTIINKSGGKDQKGSAVKPTTIVQSKTKTRHVVE